MKKFALIAVILAALTFVFSMYYEFSVVPESQAASSAEETLYMQMTELEIADPGNPKIEELKKERQAVFQKARAQVEIGTYLLFVAMFTFVLAIIPALKKQKIAWLGVALSLIALFIAAARATHMFS